MSATRVGAVKIVVLSFITGSALVRHRECSHRSHDPRTGHGITKKKYSTGMYDNILSPTDSSEGAAVAFDGVRDVAETYDATAHVLYTPGHEPGTAIAR
jgi:hypothetical protein